jgi:hypothetical protein
LQYLGLSSFIHPYFFKQSGIGFAPATKLP